MNQEKSKNRIYVKRSCKVGKLRMLGMTDELRIVRLTLYLQGMELWTRFTFGTPKIFSKYFIILRMYL